MTNREEESGEEKKFLLCDLRARNDLEKRQNNFVFDVVTGEAGTVALREFGSFFLVSLGTIRFIDELRKTDELNGLCK